MSQNKSFCNFIFGEFSSLSPSAREIMSGAHEPAIAMGKIFIIRGWETTGGPHYNLIEYLGFLMSLSIILPRVRTG